MSVDLSGTVYYQCLDPVRFADSEPARVRHQVEAFGSVFGGLLIGGVRPVLSGPQAFDNAALLSLLETSGPEPAALRTLMSRGAVQVRLLPSVQPPTLLSAFRGALRSDFSFSAWPELEHPEAREAALAWMDHAVPCGDNALEQRLDALSDMDRALRRSEVSERAVPLPGAPLQVWVRRAVRGMQDPHLSSEHAALLQDIPEGQMSSRTAWLRALADVGVQAPGAARLRMCVDAAYNRVVADSLGAAGDDVTLANPPPWMADGFVAAGLAGSSGARTVSLDRAGATGSEGALTWSAVVRLLDSMDDAGLQLPTELPETDEDQADLAAIRGQRRRLVNRECEGAAQGVSQDAFGLKVRVATAVAASGATTLAEVAGGMSGGVGAAIVSGVVVYSSELPAVKTWLTRGAGSWLGRGSGRHG